MNELREWIDLFKKHSGWISTSILLLSTILGFLMRLNDYLNYNSLCFYFGLNTEFYQYNEVSVIFTVFLGMLLLGLIGSSIYCYNRLLKSLKSKSIRSKISDIILFALFNIILVAVLSVGRAIIFEIIIILVFKKLKKIDKKYNAIQTKEEAKEKIKDILKLLPWFVLITLVFTLGWNYLLYTTKRDYQILVRDNNNDDNTCKVVVYATNEYFLTLECKIEQNNLTIYKGKQTKIKADNIKIKKLAFNSVAVK